MKHTPPSSPEDSGQHGDGQGGPAGGKPAATQPQSAPPGRQHGAVVPSGISLGSPKRGLGSDPAPVPMAESAVPTTPTKKISAFGEQEHHEEAWNRRPNTTGVGAIHVKTFHCKLTADALEYMDQSVNEWLDNHPEYEVKFVSSTVGIVTGKLKEPHLIAQVWV